MRKKKYVIELAEEQLVNLQNEAFNEFMSASVKAHNVDRTKGNLYAEHMYASYKRQAAKALNLWDALCEAVPQDCE